MPTSQTATAADTVQISAVTVRASQATVRLFNSAEISAVPYVFDNKFELEEDLETTNTVEVITDFVQYDTWRPLPEKDNNTFLVCRTPPGVHDTDNTVLELWLTYSNGASDQKLLANVADNGFSWSSFSHPEWSPDGSQIVLSVETASEWQIVIISSEVGAPDPTVVYSTTKPDVCGDPSFSPDGTTVVFTETLGSDDNISTVTLGATQVYTVLANGQPWGDPTYSSDGFFILFSFQDAAPDMTNPYGLWGIAYMYSTGLNPLQIVVSDAANLHPVWVAPTQIAWQWWDGSVFQLALCDLAGQGRMDIGEGEYPRTVVM